METTKTVYNPATGDDHLIDCQTGLETVPEKSEEEKFQDFLLDLSEDSADNFIDKLEKLHIPKETIIKYLPEYYTAEQLAEDMFNLNVYFDKVVESKSALKIEAENSIKLFREIKTQITKAGY